MLIDSGGTLCSVDKDIRLVLMACTWESAHTVLVVGRRNHVEIIMSMLSN